MLSINTFMEQEEDHMMGYETIIIGNAQQDIGAPHGGPSAHFGPSVVINGPTRPSGNYRHNSRNAPPRYFPPNFNSHPFRHETPRIVEVTDEEEQREIANPDYPRSETDANDRTGYPNQIPTDMDIPLPDYLEQSHNEDSRPDIQRANLGSSSVDDLPPPPPPDSPPPPPVPETEASATADTTPAPVVEEIDGIPNPQELHVVLRRALARNYTTQRDQESGELGHSADAETRRDLRETSTQTASERPKSRTENRPKSRADDENRRSHAGGDNRRSEHRTSHHDADPQVGPRFSFHDESYRGPEDYYAPRERHPSAGVQEPPKRSSRVIERIIITREIDPATGQPLTSVPLQNMPQPRPSRHSNVVYNDTVRGSGRLGSGRRGRGFKWQERWSPREQPMDVSGIVAGMGAEGEIDERLQYSYMPTEMNGRRGRTNQAYDVSPEGGRRHHEPRRQPDVARSSVTPTVAGEQRMHTASSAPPPYTERDMPASRSQVTSLQSEGRTSRSRGWNRADSDRSSSLGMGITQKTRVIFVIMLLLCILLLLSLVVVVTLYFTAGPGKECVSGVACSSPPVGYIIAFAVIGILAVSFMFVGIILCCFACRISRDKRMQRYPVSARR